MECIAVSFLKDIVTTLNEEETSYYKKPQKLSELPFIVKSLDIFEWPMSQK